MSDRQPIPDDQPMEIIDIELDPREVRLLETNARFMRHETYQRLVENIARDGGLTQGGGFVMLDEDGRWLCLSGNHRTEAAIDAGVEKVMYRGTRDLLSHDRRIAVQLSHNAITGEDDLAVLAELYDSIGNVDARVYAGLDDETLGLLEDVDVSSLAEANLNFQTTTLMFLPSERAVLQEVIDDARAMAGSSDVLAARLEDYHEFTDAVDAVARSWGIENVATAVRLLLDVFRRHAVSDLRLGWDNDERVEDHNNRWVPIVSVIGTDQLPPDVARVVTQAIDKMVSRDDLSAKARWQALELWAADYLGGS